MESKGCEMSQLEQLGTMTIVVADTGDIDSIRKYSPTDATTNPSLLFKAAQMAQYDSLVNDAIEWGKSQTGVSDADRMSLIVDRLYVNFGREILNIVPGYVSTEVDARLSFDSEATMVRARRIISMYESFGINKNRILIKIASTWEGIQAARQLELEGIHCNLTLLFSLVQAVACAEAGATLISPFVGRILDWFKKANNRDYTPQEDPGVQSVTAIYRYYRKFGHRTIVMGASFRNKGEILELAGCDRLTISPQLLDELKASKYVYNELFLTWFSDVVVCRLVNETAGGLYEGDRIDASQANFRRRLNDDQMATEKLSDGIRVFSADIEKLEQVIRGRL